MRGSTIKQVSFRQFYHIEIMEFNNDRIRQNYENILKDVKKYSPYPEKVKILLATKYFNLDEQKEIIDMGFEYFGENKAQDYRDKLKEFSEEKYKNLKWDFIGRLQKNKIKYIIRWYKMLDNILKETEDRMQKALESTKDKFSHVRAGRASVSMLDGVSVEAYGIMTPLNQVGTISAPEARLLTIDPWDKSIIPAIEKVILQANLGFNPSNDGKIIRLVVPELTEDRRKEYVKLVKKEAEEGKVAIRNVRKDVNNKIRKFEKDGEITEDELKSGEEKVQKMTDKFIASIDEVLSKKEKELLKV